MEIFPRRAVASNLVKRLDVAEMEAQMSVLSLEVLDVHGDTGTCETSYRHSNSVAHLTSNTLSFCGIHREVDNVEDEDDGIVGYG